MQIYLKPRYKFDRQSISNWHKKENRRVCEYIRYEQAGALWFLSLYLLFSLEFVLIATPLSYDCFHREQMNIKSDKWINNNSMHNFYAQYEFLHMYRTRVCLSLVSNMENSSIAIVAMQSKRVNAVFCFIFVLVVMIHMFTTFIESFIQSFIHKECDCCSISMYVESTFEHISFFMFPL